MIMSMIWYDDCIDDENDDALGMTDHVRSKRAKAGFFMSPRVGVRITSSRSESPELELDSLFTLTLTIFVEDRLG